MAQDLNFSAGIALCTAWNDSDMALWAQLATEAVSGDVASVLGALSYIAVQEAKTLAVTATQQDDEGREWTAADVLHALALSAEEEDD